MRYPPPRISTRPHWSLTHFRIPTPHQTPPAPFCRAHSLALSGSATEVSARQDVPGEGYAPLPYPLYARLLPRLACAPNMRLFVHFVRAAQTPPVLALRSKNNVSKIVQICAPLLNGSRHEMTGYLLLIKWIIFGQRFIIFSNPHSDFLSVLNIRREVFMNHPLANPTGGF